MELFKYRIFKEVIKGFLNGPVLKNLPANAEDMGSISGLGRSHRPWSNKAHVPQLLSLHATTAEALGPAHHN